MKWMNTIAGAALCLALVWNPTARGDDKGPIKIAVAGPHTGANATFGMQEWRGASMAVKDINANGGVLGRKLMVVKADDACEPKQAIAVANRMVSKEKVTAILGHFCSSSTIPASGIYDDAGVLMITPASTNPKVTEQGFPTILRMCGRDDQQGVVAGNFIADNRKARRVAIIHDKTTYGRGLADATRDQLKKKKISAVLYEGLTIGEKDFNALVTTIKQKKADLVYFGGLHTEAGLLLKQMRDQGVKADFVSGDGIVSNDFVTSAGGKKYVDGVFVTFGPDPRRLPESQKVVKAFEKSGYNPEGYTLYSYATIQVMAAAMKGSGSTDGAKMAKWLLNNKVSTVMGEKSWDKRGDLTAGGYVIYRWNNEGKYKEIM